MSSAPDSPAPPVRAPILGGWLFVVLIALSAAVAQAFGRFSYGLILPAVRDDLGITNALAGGIGGANVGAYLLGTLVVAWATGRFRLLAVLRFGIALASLGLLLASLSTSAAMLGCALFIAGLGGACVWIPSPMVAADAVSPARRALAIGLTGSGIGVGVMSASLLAASLRAEQGDAAWSSLYTLQALIGFGVFAAVVMIVRHQQAKPSGGGGFGGFDALMRMPGWRPLTLAYTVFGFMYLLVLGFLTTRLEDDSGWTSVDASFAFTLVGTTMIFGGPFVAAVAQRVGVRLASILFFSLWPVLVCIVLTGAPLPTLAACLGLGLLFSGLPLLMTMYVVNNTNATDYGPAFSAATLAFGLAQMISPPIGGLIADLTGTFTWVFVIAAASSLIGAAAAWRLPADR